MKNLTQNELFDKFVPKHSIDESITKKISRLYISSKDKKIYLTHVIISFIFMNIAFFGMHYYKRGTFYLEPYYYLKLLILIYGIWLLVSLIMGKFKHSSYSSYKEAVIIIAKSNSIILYIMALTVVLMGLLALSRIQILSTCLLLFLLELTAYTGFYHWHGKKILPPKEKLTHVEIRLKNFSISFLVFDFIIFGVSFYLLNYLKRGHFVLTDEYENILFVLYGIWIISSIFTRKFERKQYRNYYHAIAPFVKSYLISIGITAVTVFAFRLFLYSRLHIFGAFTLFLALEMIAYYVYFITGLEKKNGGDVETIEEVQQRLDQEYRHFEGDMINTLKQEGIKPALDKLRDKFLSKFPAVFNFINQNINLKQIDEEETVVFSTHTMYNVENLDDHAASLFINLYKVNDIRYLNRYFLEVHKKIYNGGYFIGCVETIATHKTRFYRKFSKFLAQILYPVNFFFARILPKLPGLQHIYFLFTRGKNRVFSKAEVFGRLYFCGFRIVQSEIIGDCLFYIAQRVKTPSLDRNPSYGPLIKLRRIGYNGEIMYVSKFRTMHPYSEYLQEYIHEQYSLSSNGKFANDFRLTGWGQVFRRLWIDELPQIANFFRGDLNLVGVRALSEHYFSLYPADMQQLRIQFKPGLVPPYYADMPKSFDEIIDSERQYLLAKEKHPFSTDVRYFFRAWYNILIKKARSQ